MTPPEPGLFGRVVGAVTGKVVDAVPVEEIVEEIDFDAVLDRVDINRLLDRVDVNQLLDRVDVERLMSRVDIEELVQRAGIADVVAKTTMGLAGRTLDVVRRELAGLDRIETGIVDRVLRRRDPAPLGPPKLIGLPESVQPNIPAAPRPAEPAPEPNLSLSPRPTRAAPHTRTTVTGRYAGPFSRTIAAAIDVGVILGAYSLAFWLVGVLAKALFGYSVGDGNGIIASTILLLWAALYLAVTTAISGRTVGKGIIGLIVVSRRGYPIRPTAAVVRMLTFPVSTALFGTGLLLIALRRDHRALHDLVARTAVVYDWGDRSAELPAPLTAYIRAHDAA